MRPSIGTAHDRQFKVESPSRYPKYDLTNGLVYNSVTPDFRQEVGLVDTSARERMECEILLEDRVGLQT
jgi:hypothetical protein